MMAEMVHVLAYGLPLRHREQRAIQPTIAPMRLRRAVLEQILAVEVRSVAIGRRDRVGDDGRSIVEGTR